MVSPDWTRWMLASIHSEVSSRLHAADPTLKLFIEGVDDWSGTPIPERRAELRVSGPHYHEHDPGCYAVKIWVSILLTSRIGGGTNRLQHVTDTGVAQSVLSQGIPVKRRGSKAPQDTLGDFGGLRVDLQYYNGVQAYPAGQLGVSKSLQQTEVENHFIMDIDEFGVPSDLC